MFSRPAGMPTLDAYTGPPVSRGVLIQGGFSGASAEVGDIGMTVGGSSVDEMVMNHYIEAVSQHLSQLGLSGVGGASNTMTADDQSGFEEQQDLNQFQETVSSDLGTLDPLLLLNIFYHFVVRPFIDHGVSNDVFNWQLQANRFVCISIGLTKYLQAGDENDIRREMELITNHLLLGGHMIEFSIQNHGEHGTRQAVIYFNTELHMYVRRYQYETLEDSYELLTEEQLIQKIKEAFINASIDNATVHYFKPRSDSPSLGGAEP
jgi:hypothetical protein